MAVPSDPAEIVDLLETHAGKILDILAQEHGTTRGTYEAAVAEFQGLEILKDSADPFQHGQDMRNIANGLCSNRDKILELLARLRQTDPEAASTAARSLEPLLNRSTQYIALARDTENVLIELNQSGNTQRLAGVFLTPQGRTTAALVSEQLAAREMELLPQEVGQLNWVRGVMARIESLPISPQEVRERAVELGTKISTFAAGVRGALIGARAAIPGVLESLLIWLTEFGSRLTTPIIIIGDPFGTKSGKEA